MLAAIDVGTNTIRLLLGENTSGHLIPLRYERSITRLGGGYDAEKGLSPEAMERTFHTLREFSRLIGEHEIESIRAVGTQALRQSVNGQAFVERVRKELGIPLEIISGDEEARLSARGVSEAIVPKPGRYWVFDIGGGSTEFVYCENGNILYSASYPLGVVRLAETCRNEHELKSKIAHQLDLFVAEACHAGLELNPEQSLLIGTAGTVTTIAAMDLQMTSYDWRKINNHRMKKERIDALLDQLRPLSVAERELLPGMEPGRGDLILPGLLIVSAIMDRFQQSTLAVSDFGLLEGALLSLTPLVDSN